LIAATHDRVGHQGILCPSSTALWARKCGPLSPRLRASIVVDLAAPSENVLDLFSDAIYIP
jgi:hypothetical protein